MWWIIGILFILFFVYRLLKVASDADDREKKWWEENGKIIKKETGDANED